MGYYEEPWDPMKPDKLRLSDAPALAKGLVFWLILMAIIAALLSVAGWFLTLLTQPSFYGR
jgi:hypothetical protein